MTRLRALIVDDERLARLELRRLLRAHPQIEVLDEADGVATALLSVTRQVPDVVFLDVQLTGATGFDFLAGARGSFRTVFVTAYDEHALRAFEVEALDYLLKPVNPERLARTVARLLASAQAAEAPPSTPARPLRDDDHLFVAGAREARFVRVGDIACLCAAGDYSELHTAGGERWLVPTPLRIWETRLPERFSRVHRTALVNLAHVERVEPAGTESYRLHVRGVRQPVPMSRRSVARLKRRLG